MNIHYIRYYRNTLKFRYVDHSCVKNNRKKLQLIIRKKVTNTYKPITYPPAHLALKQQILRGYKAHILKILEVFQKFLHSNDT